MSDTPQKKTRPARKKSNTGQRIFLFAVVLAIAIAGLYYYYDGLYHVSTDDAYTDGHVITIAPNLSGYVASVHVTDNQKVKAGDILVELVAQDYIIPRDRAVAALALAEAQYAAAKSNYSIAQTTYPAQYAAAKAQRDSARADLDRAEADLRRQNAVDRRATTKQQIDAASAAQRVAAATLAEKEADVRIAALVPENLSVLDAQVKQLAAQVALEKADLDRAELNLSYTKIIAPEDGWVTRKAVEPGNYVQPGQALMALVTPDVWITANFKESQLTNMRPGQTVSIRLDAYPDLKLTGRVDSLQMGSGSRFSAFPAENATGNYVKILQRIPVKIVVTGGLDPDQPLPVGLSAVPTVNIR
jgi:membrane fusion protein (multidrug efflux system)